MSAALQTAPPQPAAPLPSTGPRPFEYSQTQHSQTHSQSSPGGTRETCHAHHHRSASTSSPSAKRPPSRKTSGATAQAQVPFDPNAPVSSRPAAASAASAAAAAAAATGPGAARPSDHKPAAAAAAAAAAPGLGPGPDRPSTSSSSSNAPPIAPPRSSSAYMPPSQRRNSEKMNQSPQQHRQVDPSRAGPRPEANGAPDGKARRAAQPHQNQNQNQNQNQSSHDAAAAAYPSARDAHPVEPSAAASSSLPVRSPINPNTYTTSAGGTKHSRDASENHNRAAANGDEAARAHHYAASAHHDENAAATTATTAAGGGGGGGGGDQEPKTRSRHDHSRNSKQTTKFGDFILGNTIGEGEFGKVKLGWKQDSSVQVAIKLIKRNSVGANPSRLAKIKREVTILRGIHHPNIVRLIDMVETDRYIGIILEYASGGELFDYILNHRYLKDNSARRLFSQLISGVGYLHKKGIVHRDLKLENLLLDRNRNIIITDFGFANTFDSHDELTEEDELNLTDRDYVKRLGLDKVKANGTRKGDLMQTSCGSPCYAAPELVVSDSLYTGRKVDVWSCGVILYAMLAGYLPFDDDPANPEGDNINLLYKYIVTTPLTFPEYVTPHARDLLRRILVPNPRKRADLFEVARHSWLSEYAHVVEFITSSTTTPSEVHSVRATTADFADGPLIARSASVRETPKAKSPGPGGVGGLAKAHGKIDSPVDVGQRTSKDNKRRTVQVEYVAPVTQTQRGAEGELSRPATQPAPRYRSDGGSSGGGGQEPHLHDKSLPRDHSTTRDGQSRPPQTRRPPSSHANNGPPTSRQSRETRHHSDSAGGVRPQTGNSSQSATSLALRANYGQPAPPAVADTNAQGRIQQPSASSTTITNDMEAVGRSGVVGVPTKFAKVSGLYEGGSGGGGGFGVGGGGGGGGGGRGSDGRGHKRSSTIGEISSKILGRSGSVFGRKGKKAEQQQGEKSKKYPPISMTNGTTNVGGEEARPRQSIESKSSRRSFNFGLGKKQSEGMTNGSQDSIEKKERRRFSLLPASFTSKTTASAAIAAAAANHGRDQDSTPPSEVDSQQDLPIQDPSTDHSRSHTTAHGDARGATSFFDDSYDGAQDTRNPRAGQQRNYSANGDSGHRQGAGAGYAQHESHMSNESGASVEMRRPSTEPEVHHGQGAAPGGKANRGVLSKQHKRFTDAYDQDQYHGHGHEGSSGAAKRVMDFFRRRGKARGGEER